MTAYRRTTDEFAVLVLVYQRGNQSGNSHCLHHIATPSHRVIVVVIKCATSRSLRPQIDSELVLTRLFTSSYDGVVSDPILWDADLSIRTRIIGAICRRTTRTIRTARTQLACARAGIHSRACHEHGRCGTNRRRADVRRADAPSPSG